MGNMAWKASKKYANNILWRMGTGLLAIILSCCIPFVNIVGLKPVYPGHGSKVDNLQPEFRWEAASEPGSSYDFAIWETTQEIGTIALTACGGYHASTVRVYYVENLKENFHMITVPGCVKSFL